jgi:hypothetical protein
MRLTLNLSLYEWNNERIELILKTKWYKLNDSENESYFEVNKSSQIQ